MPTRDLILKPKSEVSAIPRTYAALLTRVRKILDQGRERARTALAQEEVRTWWETADVINAHLRIHKGRAKYGKGTVISLAADLGITERYLHEILQFQRVFKIQNLSSELTLSHYRILASIEEARLREGFHTLCVRKKLSVPGLLREIRIRKALPEQKRGQVERSKAQSVPSSLKGAPKKFRPLIPRRSGRFYTYKIIEPRKLHRGPRQFSIDLGFGARRDITRAGIDQPQPGEIVETIRTEKDPRGDKFRFKKSTKGKEVLYTYKSEIKDAHDADTPLAHIDLGFRIWHDERLRLRGIDSKELEDGGEKAARYVRRQLAKVAFVVIATTYDDKFDRPLTDLFYLEGTDDAEKILREGTFLNQELLDLGLAVRV